MATGRRGGQPGQAAAEAGIAAAELPQGYGPVPITPRVSGRLASMHWESMHWATTRQGLGKLLQPDLALRCQIPKLTTALKE